MRNCPNRIVKELGPKAPLITGDQFDASLEMLQYSIGEYNKIYSPVPVEIPNYFDADLKDIFESEIPEGGKNEWEPAHQFLSRFRRRIGDDIGYWTGLQGGAKRFSSSLLNGTVSARNNVLRGKRFKERQGMQLTCLLEPPPSCIPGNPQHPASSTGGSVGTHRIPESH